MKQPTVSIVVPVYNAKADLPRFFSSLEKQTIGRERMEILIVDGGSTDGTREYAKAHHALVLSNPKKLAEPGVVIGFTKARGNLVMVLAVDNIFRDPDAIERMVSVFSEDTIQAAFPRHDTAPDDTLLSRYINTFTDPVTHFVYSEAANARTFRNIYRTVRHTKLYDVYDYSTNPVRPIIALAQGFTVRKRALPMRTELFDDILIIHRMLSAHAPIAYVHGVSLYHYTMPDLATFVRKTRRAVQNALARKNSGITRRQDSLTQWQKAKMLLFVPYGLSLKISILYSLYYLVRSREPMWLLHPILACISALVISVEAVRIILVGRRQT